MAGVEENVVGVERGTAEVEARNVGSEVVEATWVVGENECSRVE